MSLGRPFTTESICPRKSRVVNQVHSFQGETKHIKTGNITLWSDVQVTIRESKFTDLAAIAGQGSSEYQENDIPFILIGNYSFATGVGTLSKVHLMEAITPSPCPSPSPSLSTSSSTPSSSPSSVSIQSTVSSASRSSTPIRSNSPNVLQQLVVDQLKVMESPKDKPAPETVVLSNLENSRTNKAILYHFRLAIDAKTQRLKMTIFNEGGAGVLHEVAVPEQQQHKTDGDDVSAAVDLSDLSALSTGRATSKSDTLVTTTSSSSSSSTSSPSPSSLRARFTAGKRLPQGLASAADRDEEIYAQI